MSDYSKVRVLISFGDSQWDSVYVGEPSITSNGELVIALQTGGHIGFASGSWKWFKTMRDEPGKDADAPGSITPLQETIAHHPDLKDGTVPSGSER